MVLLSFKRDLIFPNKFIVKGAFTIMNLNSAQMIAVEHFKNPMMVLAGPGSGKTTVITFRAYNLIKKYNVDPSKILVISFTKSSAEEMKERFENMATEKRVCFSTFHALFFRIIRGHYGFNTANILSSEEQSIILREIIRGFGIGEEEERDFYKNVLNEISLIKNELLDIEYYNSSLMAAEDFRRIFNMYEEKKYEFNKIDFDDMLKICHNLLSSDDRVLKLWQGKYEYILIDEFQDINRVQYECVKLLACHRNLFVVGDDDQSIYKFRGASPEFLLKFPEDFPNSQKVILNVNYRSTNEIIKLSSRVISFNKNRYEKEIVGTERKGSSIRKVSFQDIGEESVQVCNYISKLNTTKKISLDNIAIIYRTKIQARAFAEILMNMNIPFQMKDEMPNVYKHWITKDICAYLRLALNKKLDKDLVRIINKPFRYIGKLSISAAMKKDDCLFFALRREETLKPRQQTTVEELLNYLNKMKMMDTHTAFKFIRNTINYKSHLEDYADYRKMNSEGLFEILDELQEISKNYPDISSYLEHIDLLEKQEDKIKRQANPYGVTLSTIHSVKGLEFDTVFVAGCIEGLIPHEKSQSESELEEERRLFYVALTRAKNNLIISVIKTRYEEKVEESRFLEVNPEKNKKVIK